MRYLRKLLPFTTLAAAAAILHLAWVDVNRQSAARRWEGRSARPEPRGIPELEGTGLKILHFYANSAGIVEGEQATLCYGVLNASAVRIEPAVERVTPSLNRCVSVAPRQTTTYTLAALGRAGEARSASFTLPVSPAPPAITMLAQSHKQIRRGEPVTLCYSTRYATAARLEPLSIPLAVGQRVCFRFYPSATMKYTLVAKGADGRAERAGFQVAVN